MLRSRSAKSAAHPARPAPDSNSEMGIVMLFSSFSLMSGPRSSVLREHPSEKPRR